MSKNNLTERQLQRLAIKTAKEIDSDIRDRAGIGNELEACDYEIRREIKKVWVNIILDALKQV